MSDNNRISPMPTRRGQQTLQAVRDFTGGGFDADAWHVMEQRDNALIADEVLSGAGSGAFVYQFSLSGTTVTGISVVGARHLAAHYGGIKHRLVASAQKIGALHTFTSFPQPGMPMDVRCAIVPELEAEGDYYSAIVEIADLKSGNSVQVEKRENRLERKRDGSMFERPHYQVIAQSKAYRNGVLSLIPQDVQLEFKVKMLQLEKGVNITASVLDEKREGVLRFAGAKAIPVNRRAVEALTLAQISGLGDAARTGGVEQFRAAAEALGVLGGAALTMVGKTEPEPAKPRQEAKPPQQEPKPQPAKVFEVYLYDEVRDIIDGPFHSPKEFVAAYEELWRKTHDNDRERLEKANEDALALPEVQQLEGPAPTAAQPEPAKAAADAAPVSEPDSAAAVPPSEPDLAEQKWPGAGRDPVGAWITLMEERLAKLDEAGRRRWDENNREVYDSGRFSQTQRVRMTGVLRKAGLLPTRQGGLDQKHPLVEWVDALCVEISTAATADTVEALQRTAEQREAELNALNPALLRKVRTAAHDREIALQAASEEGEATP